MLVQLILGTSIAVQVAAAILALRPRDATRWRSPWLFLAGALSLMAAWHAITMARILRGTASSSTPTLGSALVVLATSVLLLMGIAGLGRLLGGLRSEAATGHEREETGEAPTHQEEAEQALARVTRGLRVLSRANEVIIRAQRESELLEKLCKVVVVEGSYRMAWIGYAGSQADDGHVRPVARWGEGSEYVDRVEITWNGSPSGQGPTGRAIRTRRPVVVRDLESDPSFDEARARGYVASLALPLTFGNHCYGALNVYSTEPDAFEEEEIELLERLAEDVAFGIRTLRLREERRELEEIVRHKQRMEALGELTGGLAHDINNLLTIILGSAGVLEETRSVDDPDFRESVRDIIAATESGAHLVRKLLASGRAEEPTFESLDLAVTTEEECRLLRRVLPETVVIEPSIEGGPLPVRADPRALNQIFLNLGFNARDAMPDGGTMKVSARRREVGVGEHGFQGPVTPGPYVCIEVVDGGIGMDAETRQRLFEPFFTTKARGRGTGLGLAVVYGLVESHDGFIQVESTLGEGTSMRIHLPLADGAPGTTSDRHLRTGENEVILLVDDDPQVRHATERILGRYGYRVERASSGREALEIVNQRSSAVALVLADVGTPHTDGRELVERIRDGGRELPVVLSGRRPMEALREMADLPGVTFLEKPWTVEELLGAVQRTLGTSAPSQD